MPDSHTHTQADHPQPHIKNNLVATGFMPCPITHNWETLYFKQGHFSDHTANFKMLLHLQTWKNETVWRCQRWGLLRFLRFCVYQKKELISSLSPCYCGTVWSEVPLLPRCFLIALKTYTENQLAQCIIFCNDQTKVYKSHNHNKKINRSIEVGEGEEEEDFPNILPIVTQISIICFSRTASISKKQSVTHWFWSSWPITKEVTSTSGCITSLHSTMPSECNRQKNAYIGSIKPTTAFV